MRKETILPIMAERILPTSTVCTDCYTRYDKLGAMAQGYTHHRINHLERVYVMGHVHTQTIQGLWSLLKRGIGVFTIR